MLDSATSQGNLRAVDAVVKPNHDLWVWILEKFLRLRT